MSARKHPDKVYMDFEVVTDCDVDVRLRQVKLVKTRKPQQCMGGAYGGPHEIPAGAEARFERALVDSDFWGRYYLCIACIDKDLEELEGEDE